MLVEDKLDPSGMFSKAGRLSLEMFVMLQEKDHILYNKKKVYSSQEATSQKQNIQKNQSESITNFNFMNKTKRNQMLAKEKQVFTKMVPREHYQDIEEKTRNNNQKFGQYHPKYHLIFEKSPLYEDQQFVDGNKQRTRDFLNIIHNRVRKNKNEPKKRAKDDSYADSSIITQRNKTQFDNSEISVLGIDYDKPHRSMVNPVLFDQQLDRKQITEGFYDPHEQRFEGIEIKNRVSRFPKSLAVRLDTQERNQSLFGSKSGGLDYSPKYTQVHKRNDLSVIDITKAPARNTFDVKNYSLNEQTLDRNAYFMSEGKSQLLKKISSPIFDRMTNRDANCSKLSTSPSRSKLEQSTHVTQVYTDR